MQFLKQVQPCSFANFEQIIAYPRRVCEEGAVSTPHIGLKLQTTSCGRDSTAFNSVNLMKLPHAKVTAGQES